MLIVYNYNFGNCYINKSFMGNNIECFNLNNLILKLLI